MEHIFQQIPHLASGNEFSVSGNIIGVRGETVFKKRAYYCYWTTDFLASGNHFFLYFSETSMAGIYIYKKGRKWLPIVEERLLYKKLVHLMNNASTSTKIALNKRTLEKKSVFTCRDE